MTKPLLYKSLLHVVACSACVVKIELAFRHSISDPYLVLRELILVGTDLFQSLLQSGGLLLTSLR